MTAFAEAAVPVARERCMIRRHAHHVRLDTLQQKIELATTQLASSRFDDDPGFDDGRGRDAQRIRGIERRHEPRCLRLAFQHRDQGRRVDHHRRPLRISRIGMIAPRLAWKAAVIVAQDLFCRPVVEFWKPSISGLNSADVVSNVPLGPPTTMARHALAQRRNHCVRDALAGLGRQLSSETIGFGMLDAQRRGVLLMRVYA
jgi:hypothetical protein